MDSGDRGSSVVNVLCYKSEGRWFDLWGTEVAQLLRCCATNREGRWFDLCEGTAVAQLLRCCATNREGRWFDLCGGPR